MSLKYRQCHLTRPEGAATVHYTAWLPDRFAVLGEVLKLRGENGNWSDHWRVTFVSREALSEEIAVKNSRAHLRQRRASDL